MENHIFRICPFPLLEASNESRDLCWGGAMPYSFSVDNLMCEVVPPNHYGQSQQMPVRRLVRQLHYTQSDFPKKASANPPYRYEDMLCSICTVFLVAKGRKSRIHSSTHMICRVQDTDVVPSAKAVNSLSQRLAYRAAF